MPKPRTINYNVSVTPRQQIIAICIRLIDTVTAEPTLRSICAYFGYGIVRLG